MSDGNAYEGPAIVELMGHRRIAGHVSEACQYGASMLRVDIPSEPPMTQFYGGSSIYALTPTTPEIVEAMAKRISTTPPVSRYELQLPEKSTAAAVPSEEDPDLPY